MSAWAHHPSCPTERVDGWFTDPPLWFTRPQTRTWGEKHQDTAEFRGQSLVAIAGDCITAGHGASSRNHSFPARLHAHLGSSFKVTNLGKAGATLNQASEWSYARTKQYSVLVRSRWHYILFMLGTNDAKDWPDSCDQSGGPGCRSLEESYAALLRAARGSQNDSVRLMLMTPPLTVDCAYGMKAAAINRWLPALIERVARSEDLPPPIDVFGALGGREAQPWPFSGCELKSNDTNVRRCSFFCDVQSCDPVHPNDHGYEHIARVVHSALVASSLALVNDEGGSHSTVHEGSFWLWAFAFVSVGVAASRVFTSLHSGKLRLHGTFSQARDNTSIEFRCSKESLM
mmetsp:Transcript_23108/g.34562  ORF Transcript_23108/g.34562 Transcript_23108/m.34562 type:complete len:344 (+) Transcript_23108:27-1058(+)